MNQQEEISAATGDVLMQLARQRIEDLRRDGARLRIAD
jgi:hypothetical protein